MLSNTLLLLILYINFTVIFCFKRHDGELVVTASTEALSGISITKNNREKKCPHKLPYYVTHDYSFNLCVGNSVQDKKDNRAIIGVISSRGYLSTCRVLHLLLWMKSQISVDSAMSRDYFVDVGMNLGSCTSHIASLGFPTLSIDPLIQHIELIRSTTIMNPSFPIEAYHGGIARKSDKRYVLLTSGAQNFGSTSLKYLQGDNYTSGQQFGSRFDRAEHLRLFSLDEFIGTRHVSMLKIDCEGCEAETLLSGRKALRKIPIIKLELNQQKYKSGYTGDNSDDGTVGGGTINPTSSSRRMSKTNSTSATSEKTISNNKIMHKKFVTPNDIILYLNNCGYLVFTDYWSEHNLGIYFGKNNNKVFDIDSAFGTPLVRVNSDSSKNNVGQNNGILNDPNALHNAAKKILSNMITPESFKLGGSHDIIAIKKSLAYTMQKHFSVSNAGTGSSSNSNSLDDDESYFTDHDVTNTNSSSHSNSM